MPATKTATTRRRMALGDIDALRSGPSAPRERLVLDAVRLVGVGAELLLAEGLVLAEVALEPPHLRIALEGEDVRGDAIEEPPIVADDHRAAGEGLQPLF